MQAVLLGAGPHESLILMCDCGALEVTRAPDTWKRFTPLYEQRRCHCLSCGKTQPLGLAPGSEGVIDELVKARQHR
ncbi:hypothetical protein [Halomonas sp. YLGW01]|uniref:hypothetical protein n=1 Tax=Halomonas sp. YLGW01 TaxID=2773308 RepID=UPI0017853FCA|nr:hypothetical protein [Halomonas sp. YLGW01]